MKRYKKILALSLSILLTLSLMGCKSTDPNEEQAAFDAFIEQEFIETMENDYTTMHVYLQDPEAFGIDREKVEVNLGTRLDADEPQADDEEQTGYEKFQEFDRDALTDEQQDIYDIYAYQASIQEALDQEKFAYYAPAFESMSGLHYQLPTLFADWDLRNEQDIKDLIALLKDVRPYIDSALRYTKEQEERGLLMLDIDSIMEYCESILEKGENSSIITSIEANIDALSLDETASSTYKREVKEAFRTSFLPAYQSIYDTMKEFADTAKNNTQGLAHFENGKEYYELLLQQNIGSDKSVEEIRTMMETAFDEHIMNMFQYLSETEDMVSFLSSGELPKTGYTSYNKILDDIQDKFRDDFPAVDDLRYHIKDINEEIASGSGVAAYFNIPSLDGNSIKQLRVNPKTSDIASVSTYSTVAHEGFPGHMYQYAYMYENIDDNFTKALASSLAYTEGYAVYAQYASFAYLEDVDQNLLALYRENELATYCAIIVADIGIHYDGWSLEQFSEYLTDAGLALDEKTAKLQYEQLQANPAAFQPYYVGYHEIMDLREKAETALGDAFEQKAFHEALLESGNAPFEVVERHIDAYIEETK